MSARIVTVALALCAMAAPAAAADVAAGQVKAKEVCQSCHGLDGNSTIADYPKLGGQYPDYLMKALRDYQSGARKNAIMGPFAGMLTAKDIENVAAYYASQPPAVQHKY
jgi:cytochrome c553